MKAVSSGTVSTSAITFCLGFGAALLLPLAWSAGSVDAFGWSAAFDRILAVLTGMIPRPSVLLGTLALILVALSIAALLRMPSTSATSSTEKKQAPRQGLSHDAATTAEIGREIADVLKLLRSFLEANSKYADTLDRAQISLSRASSQDQVWDIVKLLLAENDAVRNDVRDLRSQLVVSREYIEELRNNLARAEEAALLDPLTGVGNRRRFDQDLQQAVEKAHLESAPMCLLLADLDNFKRINDRFGHPFGDEVLKLFAALLKQTVKGRDRIARFGGEEFAIILPNTLMGNAFHLAEQIRRQLQTSSWISERTGQPTPPLTASIGIAQLGDGDSAPTLLKRADAKLYEAKQGGRNQIVIEHSVAA